MIDSLNGLNVFYELSLFKKKYNTSTMYPGDEIINENDL